MTLISINVIWFNWYVSTGACGYLGIFVRPAVTGVYTNIQNPELCIIYEDAFSSGSHVFLTF